MITNRDKIPNIYPFNKHGFMLTIELGVYYSRHTKALARNSTNNSFWLLY